MNVFGIGLPDMMLIGVVALLVFGPKKLPEIGRSLGKTIRSFQDASKEFETEFKREAERVENWWPGWCWCWCWWALGMWWGAMWDGQLGKI